MSKSNLRKVFHIPKHLEFEKIQKHYQNLEQLSPDDLEYPLFFGELVCLRDYVLPLIKEIEQLRLRAKKSLRRKNTIVRLEKAHIIMRYKLANQKNATKKWMNLYKENLDKEINYAD